MRFLHPRVNAIIRAEDGLIALGLFVVALLVRLAVLVAHPFDGLYGQDAFAYYDYARDLWAGAQRLLPPAPFHWPLGYPALTLAAFALLGPTPVAAQAASILCGALAAPLVFLLVREVAPACNPETAEYSRSGATLAGLVAALSGQLLQLSVSVMSDAPAVFWATLSALALARYSRYRSTRWLALASFALACTVITRLLFAALMLPWSLAFIAVWARAGGSWIERFRQAGLHAALAALIALPLAIIQSTATISSDSFQHPWLVGWHPLNALRRVFDNTDGHFEYALPVGLFYAQPVAHPYYTFPLFLPLIAAGLWAMRRAPPAVTLVVAGWAAAVYGFLMGIPYENFRFGLALWPPLVVLAGVGFDRFWPLGARLPSSAAGRTAKTLLTAVAVLGLAGMAVWSARGLQSFFLTHDEHLAVTRWAAGRVPPAATVITMGLTQYFQHYTDLPVVELYLQDTRSLSTLTCGRTDVFLLVDEDNIRSQWAGREPEHNFRWLRDTSGLLSLDRRGPYTLYRVAGACAAG